MKTMKKTVILSLSCFLFQYVPSLAAAAGTLEPTLLQLQQGWAKANYATPEKAQEKAFDTLVKQADALVRDYPSHAEPLVWKAIILSTEAGVVGGLGALGEAKQARKLLEQAEALDAETLQGSVYTSLGSLYYKVPGWPIGFGDDDKAGELLKKALAINPDGIDPNYFYADYLFDQGDYVDARKYAEHALTAKPRKARPLADQGRRKDIQTLLTKLQDKLASAKSQKHGGGLWN